MSSSTSNDVMDSSTHGSDLHELAHENNFTRNQLIFAKLMDSRQWRMAKILDISTKDQTVKIIYLDSPSASATVDEKTLDDESITLPIHPETIQSIDSKRKRKLRVNLEEEERTFYHAIGVNKKMKNTSTTPPKSMKVLDVQEDEVVAPRAISKNQRNQQINEAATESSLKDHIALLKPFVSSKVYEKISTSPSSTFRPHHIASQPSQITKATLRDYQVAGVSWLVNQYLKSINCILADEMGLGKTLQTISYISYLTTELNIPGPHLIVVPLSVLFNWILEFRTFCPSLRIVRMHSNNPQDQLKFREVLASMARYTSNESDGSLSSCPYDVVITTYEMVKGKLESSLKRVFWRTMILDEGHRIKNDESLITKACLHYKARFKIILTGTPVQNNLHETYTLLHYLHPNIFNISDSFDEAFQFNGNDINVDQHLVDKAHYLLRIFLLRRIKTEVEQQLPPKLETIVKCPMSPMQLFWSKRLLLRESDLLTSLENKLANEGIKTTTTGNAWKRLQSLVAQLRKAANHPYLFPDAEDISSSDDLYATEEIVTASGKMMMLDRLLPVLLSKHHRVVLFSQYTRTLDIIQDYLELRDYKFSRLDGSTHRVNREVRITQFNRSGSETFIFLLSTRAGGEGVNLYTADTVILFDSDWNPQVDIQAMARVHRIGQTKTVHIYRFVTSGTVEERIVQRAQKKLYLDSLVNRGCTSQALELDKLRGAGQKPTEENENIEGNDEDISTMMSALKFGFGAVFSKEDVAEKEVTLQNIITHDEILTLIDRNRGIKPSHHLAEAPMMRRANSVPNFAKEGESKQPQLKRGKSVGAEDENTYLSQEEESLIGPSLSRASSLTENQEESVSSFQRNLSAPLISVRSLNGEHHPRQILKEKDIQESLIIKSVASSSPAPSDIIDLTTENSFDEIGNGDVESDNPSIEEVTEEKTPPGRRKSDGGGSLKSIATDWVQEKQRLQQNQRSIRQKQVRTETVHLSGVGMVQVLKVNQYSLEDGEPSVFHREMKNRKANWGDGPTRKGKMFIHQDFCQDCWDGGTLVCCNYCPASYHPKCVGLKAIPSGIWVCPHHAGCGNCGKSKSSSSFSFRCEVCPLAFCEDCLPTTAVILDGCARWKAQGFDTPGSCCFIQCSKECSDWIAENPIDTF